MSSSLENPGTQLAAAVDAKAVQYRKIQEEIRQLENDRQLLMQQQNENEMVKQELALLDDTAQVYKMLGPVLLKNDTDDAKQTVNQRLELITGEMKKIDSIMREKEEISKSIADEVRKMNQLMQKAAVEAAKLAAQNV